MKKILLIEAILLIILVATKPIVNAICLSETITSEWINKKTTQSWLNKIKIKREIENTKDKKLVVNKIIDGKQIMFYEHKVYNSYFVKNDSILLHLDIQGNHITKYEKTWTEINFNYSNYEYKEFETHDYHWKHRAIFPDEDDLQDFYTFYDEQDYPVFCWEVRYRNGETFLYNLNGTEIGYGIPAPTDGFSLSGYDKGRPHDPWYDWRVSADNWFSKWCDVTVSLSHPLNSQISEYIQNPELEYFYEIGHSGGLPTRFQSHANNSYYTADQLCEDMKNRSPMRLAVICSCEAMRETGVGTLSYEFRKGEIENTVTIGYVGMGGCPGWLDSLNWQNYMFTRIYMGKSFKKAFDMACAQYPRIADCVEFVGDTNLRLRDIPDITRIYRINNEILQKISFIIIKQKKRD